MTPHRTFAEPPAITESQAIEIALAAFRENGGIVGERRSVHAHWTPRGRYGGKRFRGWVVSIPLPVPPAWEPDGVYARVADPSGEVIISSVI